MTSNRAAQPNWDQEVTLPYEVAQEIQKQLTSLRMPPKALRVTMARMGKQQPVRYGDALNAVAHYLAAAATANGQSMGRRADRDCAMRVWNALHAVVGIDVDYADAPVPTSPGLDISSEDKLEAWLEL